MALGSLKQAIRIPQKLRPPRTAVAVVGKGHTLESFWGSMLLVIFFGELVPLAPKAQTKQQLLFFCQTCKGKVSWLASGSGSQAQKKGPKDRDQRIKYESFYFLSKTTQQKFVQKEIVLLLIFLFLSKTVFRAHPSKKGVGAQMPLVYEGQKKAVSRQPCFWGLTSQLSSLNLCPFFLAARVGEREDSLPKPLGSLLSSFRRKIILWNEDSTEKETATTFLFLCLSNSRAQRDK